MCPPVFECDQRKVEGGSRQCLLIALWGPFPMTYLLLILHLPRPASSEGGMYFLQPVFLASVLVANAYALTSSRQCTVFLLTLGIMKMQPPGRAWGVQCVYRDTLRKRLGPERWLSG